MFFGISLAISLVLKLNLNPIAYRGATVLTGVGFGYLYGEYKCNNNIHLIIIDSDQIFSDIMNLPDRKLELER